MSNECQEFQILIVENDRMMWPVYRRALRTSDYVLEFVDGVDDALKKIECGAYGLIILDMGLNPGTRLATGLSADDIECGEQLFLEVRKTVKTPILVVSVYTGTYMGRELLDRLHPDRQLEKPIRPRLLQEAVSQLRHSTAQ